MTRCELIQTPKGLGLFLDASNPCEKPLIVDFCSGKLNFRQQKATTKNEAIAKAVGLKKGISCTIIDTTAGLGQDAFILASLGAELILLERSAIVAALLKDGLERLPNLEIRSKMHLIEIDACDYLSRLEPAQYPDVIYCDPMFPQRQKSALVKKEMQYLQAILDKEPTQSALDTEKLLALAIQSAKKRVVVKRPRLAPCLIGPKPNFNYLSKNNRFDIYLK